MVEWKKLVLVSNVQYGFPFDSTLFTEDESYIPLIRIRDIKPAKASTYYSGDYLDDYIIRKGDILVGMDGEFNLEKWNDRDGLLNQRVLKISGKQDICLDGYIYHYMGPVFKEIEKKTAGGSVKHLSAKVVNSIQIPIPSKSEQERIVSILDTFTSSIANLKEQIKERRKQYEHYRDQLLDLEGKEGVEMKTLGKMASFKYGYTSKANEIGSHRYIRITDIDKYGRLYFEDEKYINASNEAEDYILKKDDIVVARTGATYGKTLIFEYDFPAIYASFLIKVDLQDFLLPKYYWHFAQSSFYWKQANKLVGGGAQPQFNVGAISQICIPIPSKQEQSRIVTILDQFEAIIANLEAQLKEREKQYEYYRNQLLTFE